MSFDRIIRDELSEVAQLRRDLEDLKATVLARTSGLKGSWTNYTPALTAATTNPTLGSGGNVTGRYIQQGKQITVQFFVLFGSSGVDPGSGEYRISMPFPMSTATPGLGITAQGPVVLLDWSVAGHKELAVAAKGNGDYVKFFTKNATVWHNNPFIWAADDRFGGTVIYERI